MHSVIQAAPGVWQFLTKSRNGRNRYPGLAWRVQILAQDHCTMMVPVIPGGEDVSGVAELVFRV